MSYPLLNTFSYPVLGLGELGALSSWAVGGRGGRRGGDSHRSEQRWIGRAGTGGSGKLTSFPCNWRPYFSLCNSSLGWKRFIKERKGMTGLLLLFINTCYQMKLSITNQKPPGLSVLPSLQLSSFLLRPIPALCCSDQLPASLKAVVQSWSAFTESIIFVRLRQVFCKSCWFGFLWRTDCEEKVFLKKKKVQAEKAKPS